MSKLMISTAMTIDGVIEVSDWYIADGEHTRAAFDMLGSVDALLMGRKTYEGLAAYWAPLDDEWANLLNPLPKHVASRTLQGPLEWNATVIEGDVAESVSKLKDDLQGDLFLTGCGELAHYLLDQGVIDELVFWIHPSTAGQGARPFEAATSVKLELLESKTFDAGVTLLRYKPV
jgi:dihydrofolate reductase